MEEIKVKPEEVKNQSLQIEKIMAQKTEKLSSITQDCVKALNQGDTSIQMKDIFKSWVKDTCDQLSKFILDEYMYWIPNENQP